LFVTLAFMPLPANTVAVKRAEMRKAKMLELLSQGLTVGEAVEKIGVTRAAYDQWRTRDRDFAQRADEVRYENPATPREHWDGTFVDFSLKYLGREHVPAFHRRAMNAMEHSPEGSIGLMLWPPEHAKTSLLEDRATFKICTNPNIRITAGSEKITHPRKMLFTVQRRLIAGGGFPELVKKFGPFKRGEGDEEAGEWSQNAFRVLAATEHRDPTMSVTSIRSALQGVRADDLYVDDIQGRKSLGQTDYIASAVRQDWFTRSGAFGRAFMVGTRVGPGDVYEVLMDAGVFDWVLKFPAYKESEDSWPAPNRDVAYPKQHPANIAAAQEVKSFLWPERYTPENYLGLRIIAGEEAWDRNYMQKGTTAGECPFNENMLAAAGLPLQKFHDRPPPTVNQLALALDPGFGVNATMLFGFTAKQMYVLNWRVDRGLANNQNIVGILGDYCSAYQREQWYVGDIIIENKAFQKGLLEDESLRELRAKWGFRVMGHQTGSEKNDPDWGIPSMARAFERGEILLPDADDPATKAARALLDDQLLKWRPHKRGNKLTQDLTMTLWFGWMLWKMRRNSLSEVAGGNTVDWQVGGLPYKPTGSGLLVPSGR
jgi:hypothetical protein